MQKYLVSFDSNDIVLAALSSIKKKKVLVQQKVKQQLNSDLHNERIN